MNAPELVLVRDVSASFPSCIRTGSAAIDLDAARAQHACYVAAIGALGIPVRRISSLDASPDAVFVEDTAVILGRSAVVTCPGAEARRAEVDSVARVLSELCEVHTMKAPATLDGGDVLRVGRRLYVGMSGRTNRAGFEFLAGIAAREGIEAIAVPVDAGLHLKSGCTIADEETLLCHRASIDPAPFRGVRVIEVDEMVGANVLALGAAVLVSAAAPRTREILEGRGQRVVSVDVGEMHKGDGALTCLSLRVPTRGGWAT